MMVAALGLSEWVQVGSALITLALAAATVLLAVHTRRMAKATRDVAEHTERQAEAVLQQTKAVVEQVAVTRSALQASIMPWLTASVERLPSVAEDERGTDVEITVWNVGRGLALLRSQGYRIISHPRVGMEAIVRTGRAEAAVIPPDGGSTVHFTINRRGESTSFKDFTGQHQGITGEFFVEMDYTDARDEQGTTACFQVCRDPEMDPSECWSVSSIGYRREGDTEKFVSIEFAPDSDGSYLLDPEALEGP